MMLTNINFYNLTLVDRVNLHHIRFWGVTDDWQVTLTSVVPEEYRRKILNREFISENALDEYISFKRHDTDNVLLFTQELQRRFPDLTFDQVMSLYNNLHWCERNGDVDFYIPRGYFILHSGEVIPENNII